MTDPTPKELTVRLQKLKEAIGHNAMVRDEYQEWEGIQEEFDVLIAMSQQPDEPRAKPQRYAILGRLIPLSANGVSQVGLLDQRAEASHEVYLASDIDNSPRETRDQDDERVVYGVIVTSKEARSGVTGNPIMTQAGDRFWATVEPEGWVEASSSRFTSAAVPSDVLTFKSRARAEAFAKRWKGHPWWCVPDGQYEIVPLRAIYVSRTKITGYERIAESPPNASGEPR